jgi:LysM repeat protein
VVELEPPRRVWAARLAAPVAFFAAATVLVILVASGLNGGSSTATSPSAAPTLTSPTTSTGTSTGRKKKKRVYRVHRGDTLESIAAKFHTTVDDLLQLNPDVDPLALSPGQRIRVS